MKVKCINGRGWCCDSKNIFGRVKTKECKGPSYGDELTVEREYFNEGKKYYDLKEWPSKGNDDGWQADQFIPLQEDIQAVTYSELIIDKPISVN